MTQRLYIRLANVQRRRIEADRHVLHDRHELFRQQGHVMMFEQRFARPFLRDFAGVRENFLERAKLSDQLLRGFFPDPLHTWHVVRRVTNQREVVNDTFGRHAESVVRILHPDPRLFDTRRSTATGIKQPDTGTHELLKVLVTRNDDNVVSGFNAKSGECADDVVGFVPRHAQHRDIVRFEQLLDALQSRVKIGLQFVRQLFARRLVLRIQIDTERCTGVVHPAEQFGLVCGQETLEKICDAPCGRGVLAATGVQRPREQREERAIDQRIAINEKKSRCRRLGYITHGRLAIRRRIAF